MREHKIVIMGSMGSGKTTAIRAVSDSAVVSTDVRNTDLESSAKLTTTVAMDYGDISLPNGDRLRLYGTPGQDRFEFIWPIVSFGATGAILLVDATATEPLRMFKGFLEVLRRDNPDLPVVAGVTKLDQTTTLQIDNLYDQAEQLGFSLPVVPVDARDKSAVLNLLDILMSEIDALSLLAGMEA
mgnify:CR=1 FL=1